MSNPLYGNLVSEWSVNHTPAADTQAIASQAGVPGKTHFVTGIYVSHNNATGLVAVLTEDVTGTNVTRWNNLVATGTGLQLNFACPLRIATGKAVQIASGLPAGGTSARATITGFTV